MSIILMSRPLIAYQEPEPLPGAPLDGSVRKKPLLPPLETKPTIEDILHGIFPPIYYQQDGRWYVKMVSTEEPSRERLKVLEGTLMHNLEVRQASKNGICPIREDVHNELMDELIRQCTINCPERGLLLMRVRDNLKMTFASY
jgi:dynein light intermediate chain